MSNVHDMQEYVKLCPRIAKHEFLISWLMHIKASPSYALPKYNPTCHINEKDIKDKTCWIKLLVRDDPKIEFWTKSFLLWIKTLFNQRNSCCVYLHHPTFVATKSNISSFVIKLVQNGCINRFICVHKMSCTWEF